MRLRDYLRVLQTSGMDVRFVVVFGSWAKGRADAWSDIDVKVNPALFLSSREPDTRNGFHAVEGTPLFLQYRQADRAWQCAYKLARNLGVLIRVYLLSSRTAVPGYSGRLLCPGVRSGTGNGCFTTSRLEPPPIEPPPPPSLVTRVSSYSGWSA